MMLNLLKKMKALRLFRQHGVRPRRYGIGIVDEHRAAHVFLQLPSFYGHILTDAYWMPMWTEQLTVRGWRAMLELHYGYPPGSIGMQGIHRDPARPPASTCSACGALTFGGGCHCQLPQDKEGFVTYRRDRSENE